MQELIDIFSNLIIPKCFGGNVDTEDYNAIGEWGYDVINNHLPVPAHYNYGVSKLAFILEAYNWVVKIPFNGYYSASWDEEKNTYSEDEEEFFSFQYAMNDWDYCNTELEKYKKAIEKGLSCFFAETKYLCKGKNDHPIYIQEKVIPINEDTLKRTPSKKSLKFAKKQYYFNNEWLATAVDFYGMDKVVEFLDYINNIDPEISQDLHYGNYGYRLDGSPCLLDFSGWNENI